MSQTFAIEAPHGATINIPETVADDFAYFRADQLDEIATYYKEQGYVVVRNLIPADLCDRCREAFQKEVKPYSSYLYRQATANPEKHVLTSHNYMLNSILNIQDLEQDKFPKFREYGMEVLTLGGVQNVLRKLFHDEAKLVQSMYFEGNPATWAHQDSYYLDSSELGRMVAGWFAVEDIQPGAGRFYVYPESHLIDIEKNGGDFDIAFHHNRYKKLIIDIINNHNLVCKAPALGKGDVLFWHGKTIHGSLPTTQPQYSRSSYTGHYIPKSTDFLQYQSKIKKLNLKEVNGMPVNFPKDQNVFRNRLILKLETTFPKTFQTVKKIAIKLVTR